MDHNGFQHWICPMDFYNVRLWIKIWKIRLSVRVREVCMNTQ